MFSDKQVEALRSDFVALRRRVADLEKAQERHELYSWKHPRYKDVVKIVDAILTYLGLEVVAQPDTTVQPRGQTE